MVEPICPVGIYDESRLICIEPENLVPPPRT